MLSLRIPTLIVMLLASFAIGSASILFQSIINKRIVTPCLLGMNSMYTLVHTAVVFVVGSGSIIVTNSNLSFAIDLIVMYIAATFIGTVLSSFFGSIQSTMIRVMDPNEYDTLLTTLVADFNNVNGVVESTRYNAQTTSIFGKEAEVDALFTDFQPRIDALNAVLKGKDVLLGMYNSNALGLMD